MIGKDGKPHHCTLDADSSCDAVDQAIQLWARLGCFDSDTVMIVQIVQTANSSHSHSAPDYSLQTPLSSRFNFRAIGHPEVGVEI